MEGNAYKQVVEEGRHDPVLDGEKVLDDHVLLDVLVEYVPQQVSLDYLEQDEVREGFLQEKNSITVDNVQTAKARLNQPEQYANRNISCNFPQFVSIHF